MFYFTQIEYDVFLFFSFFFPSSEAHYMNDISRKFDRFILIRLEILCHLVGFYHENVYVMPFSMVHFHQRTELFRVIASNGIQYTLEHITSVACAEAALQIWIELYLGN